MNTSVHELETQLCAVATNVPRPGALAMMLGTRHSSVTAAAGILHKAALIEIFIRTCADKNRSGLEGAACECYAVVHDEYVRLDLL